MNAHPDTAIRAAAIVHRERVASGQRAELINQVARLRSTQRLHPRLLARIARLATVRHRSTAALSTRQVERFLAS
jgi:predicted site-specific integrase-resolvase